VSVFVFLHYAVANLEEEAESFTLFETQTCIPDIILSSKPDDAAANRILKRLSSDFRTPSCKKLPVIDMITVDDDDDFVEPIKNTRIANIVGRRRKDPALSSRNITTTKRANKRTVRLRYRVPTLKPGRFIHPDSARLLRGYILSDHAKQRYKE